MTANSPSPSLDPWLSTGDSESSTPCNHHWHGPFDDLDESFTCCDCGARRIVPTVHPRSCRCASCQSEQRDDHNMAGWS